MIQAYDATKIIDALKYCAYGDRGCDKCPVGKDCKGMTNKAMTLAIEWIEMEATKKQPHWIDNWISVKDRLPEQVGCRCLVSAEFGDGKRTVFTAFTGYGEPRWWTYDITHMDRATYADNRVHHNYHITHWMPLPEPPKENE